MHSIRIDDLKGAKINKMKNERVREIRGVKKGVNEKIYENINLVR